MFQLKTLFVPVLLFIIFSSSYAQQINTAPTSVSTMPTSAEPIIIWKEIIDSPSDVLIQILSAALTATNKKYGSYQFIVSPTMGQQRALNKLTLPTSDRLDIAHFSATPEREQRAIAVRVPLLDGMLGQRICLIKAGTQQKFSQINDKQDLIDHAINFGLHKDWADTRLLRNNQLTVTTTYKYSLLFKQLERARFDCFSRGITEIYNEYIQHAAHGLEIEQELLLEYPFPVFFFVNSNRPKLAERLNEGLKILHNNGQLENILQPYKEKIEEYLNIENRRIIHLNNPLLTKQTILAIKEYTNTIKQ